MKKIGISDCIYFKGGDYMKKIIFSLLIITMITTVTACEKKENAPVPEQNVMLVITYTNYAWGYDFNGKVISSGGGVYYLPDDFDMDEEGLYERLDEIILNNEPESSIGPEDIGKFYEFAENMESYDKSEYECRGNYMCDYGSRSVRGFYTDGDGEVKCVSLFSYGDNIYCRKDKTVAKFANWLSKNGYFNTDGYKF